MSEAETNVQSHTLAYLRRIDRNMQQLTELFVRQQQQIGRLERDMREGFESVRREMQTLHRDMSEVKSDMVLMENRIVSTLTADHEFAARLNETEERLTALESARPAL